MKRIQKLISWLTAFALMISMAAGAVAELETNEWTKAPFQAMFNAGNKMLTDTDNFTATGTADFYLDGELFKHADGVYAQEGENCYQSISLKTPRENGTERENGYTVVDYGGLGYGIEYYGGVKHYFPVTNVPKTQALRDSIPTETMMNLGARIAEYLDLTANRGEVKQDAGKTAFSLRWETADIPSLVQSGVNLFWQAAIQRYFMISYEDMSLTGDAAIEDYSTLTQGIIFSARKLELQRLDLDAFFNEKDELLSLDGTAWIEILCRNADTRMLRIAFSLEGNDYGITSVEAVIPEENRNPAYISNQLSGDELPQFFDTVASAGGLWADYGLPEVVFPMDHLNHRVISTPADAEEYALEICTLDTLGFQDASVLIWSVSLDKETQRYTAVGFDPDDAAMTEPLVSLTFDRSGFVWVISNHASGYENANDLDFGLFDSDQYTAWRSEIGLTLWAFQENLNPGSTLIYAEGLRESLPSGIGYTSYHQTMELDDKQFVVMYGMLHRNPYEKVKYIVQTKPIYRVVEMDATIEPEEGGNG
ncbi:MAG: hypothetical protein IJ188_02150 [Clostridia bacterium]|nr:hypothetical protein [Clostridia bacterium]